MLMPGVFKERQASPCNKGESMIMMSESDNYIALATKAGSIAEVSRVSNELWYFNRLKSKSPGDGTKLMAKLVELLDDRKIVLQCLVNPYGSKSLDELVSFYASFGFELQEIDEPNNSALMLRILRGRT
jgi:hypothetical protein